MKGMGPIDLQRQPNQREIQGSTFQKNHWDPSHLPQANKDGDRPFSCCPGTPRDPADPPEGRQGSGRNFHRAKMETSNQKTQTTPKGGKMGSRRTGQTYLEGDGSSSKRVQSAWMPQMTPPKPSPGQTSEEKTSKVGNHY